LEELMRAPAMGTVVKTGSRLFASVWKIRNCRLYYRDNVRHRAFIDGSQ
jgi:hypothetical protein